MVGEHSRTRPAPLGKWIIHPAKSPKSPQPHSESEPAEAERTRYPKLNFALPQKNLFFAEPRNDKMQLEKNTFNPYFFGVKGLVFNGNFNA
jgi:hypothetical protein